MSAFVEVADLAGRPIPTTLILDFYDSYTRNLLSLFSQLEDAATTGGAEDGKKRVWDCEAWQERVVVVNVDSMSWDDFTTNVLPHVSCVILGPGPGSPHKTSDFSWPTRLIQEYGDVLPILGLCLGHQGLATAFGGSVVVAPAPRHGQISHIRHTRDPLFEGMPEDFKAVQYNSLVVAASDLPQDLEAIAWTDNGKEENIMGLRHRTSPLWGSIASTYGPTLLSNFLALTADHHAQLLSLRGSIPSTLPFPPRVLSLTTSYQRGLPSVIPDVPALAPQLAGENWRWEQRSINIGSAGSRTPRDVFEGFIKDSSPLGAVWLDSARPTVSPQYSHVFAPQLTWSYSCATNVISVRDSVDQPPSTVALLPPTTFFSTLATAQGMLKRSTKIIDASLPSVPVGFVGFLGYEMKAVSLPHQGPLTASDERTDSEFAFASAVLSYEHATGDWRATGLVRVRDGSGEAREVEEVTRTRFGLEEAEWKAWTGKVSAFFATERSVASPALPAQTTFGFLGGLKPDLEEEDYKVAIERARQSIIAGDSYELCLTTQFRTTVPPSVAADPYPLYLALRAANPAPYSAYFHLPLSQRSMLSSSPERFMHITKQGLAEMKPIKGTVARSEDPVEDLRRKEALQADEKERAENLMIVDLCRNDLLGFCDVKSVKVPRLMVVESYQTVHQLVTSVVGQLTPVVNPFEAVARAFPPGSMTGAPKIRSVKLLEDLECGRPRGAYAGVFGFVAVDGTTDFSVVIRTLVIEGNKMTLGSGGAITHLSNPEDEWNEVLVKRRAVVGRLQSPSSGST